ncbi:hypothetical protein HYV49_01585 [Candidatus Pacearchaeota archaeon]|nr:hypothetical protein [Candidatus Pacearchaeota archaeon]
MNEGLIVGYDYYLGHSKQCVIYAGISNRKHQFASLSLDSSIKVTEISLENMLYSDELRTAFDMRNFVLKSHLVNKSIEPEEYNRLISIIRSKDDSK